ncbi:MAG: polyprenyl synthetase family protein [Thermoproteales archaeon]|nr:polyprenyl synthetase family protein [Thermoproteales archaeon]
MSIIDELAKLGKMSDKHIKKYLLMNTSKEFEEVILYQINTGGKRIRPALTLASCLACEGDINEAFPAAASVEIAHNYSLILDDIIDHSELRRGKPTVWKKYGISTAILVAVHYRESATEALNDTYSPREFNKMFARTLKLLTDGERLDILFEQSGREDEPYVVHNRYSSIEFENYLEMIYKKTGALIETSCIFGGLSARADKKMLDALSSYGKMLGYAFQIGDDIIDLFGETEKTGKKVGGDIIEHKFGNAVIALALQELEEEKREKLLHILRKDKVLDNDIKEAIKIIEKYSNARQKAETLRQKYSQMAIESLSAIPNNKGKEYLIELANFISLRRY